MTPQDIIASTLHAEANGEWFNSFENQAQGILSNLDAQGYRLVHSGNGATHWADCWKVHHLCAVALIERLIEQEH